MSLEEIFSRFLTREMCRRSTTLQASGERSVFSVGAVVRRRGSPVDAVVRRLLRKAESVDAVVRRRAHRSTLSSGSSPLG